jgi:hypothetical protein
VTRVEHVLVEVLAIRVVTIGRLYSQFSVTNTGVLNRRLLQEVVAFSKDSHVVLYPWIKLDGSIDNLTLSRLKRNIFSLIHQNPGINEVSHIYNYIKSILRLTFDILILFRLFNPIY